MASEATINQRLLDAERAKPVPDPDIIYALEQTRPYWNTVDNGSIRAGFEKLAALKRQEDKSHDQTRHH